MRSHTSDFVVPSRQPAARVAGQRRRLSRPPRVPRSNTLPVLNREAASGVSNGGVCGGTGSGFHTRSQEGATSTHAEEGAVPLEASRSMMNLRSPLGVPTEGPIIQDRRQVRDNASPAPTAESAISSVVESSKKKHILALRNPFSSSSKQTLEQTPFPPDTPTKAARFLGVDAPEASGSEEHPRTAHRDNGALDGVSDERLWSSKEDENDPPKSQSFWKTSKKTAKKMSVALSNLLHPPPKTPSRYSQANLALYTRTRATNAELETDYVDSIGHEPSSSDRKGKGKAPAHLPLITETSRDEDGGDDELDVINEYASFPPRGDSLAVFVRSPLQAIEDRLLDELDAASDGVSIRSSIELGDDEVPEVCCAQAVTVTRVKPGMVKWVDIPARRVCRRPLGD